MAAGGSERIDEACASPAVDPDCSVAAVELLQHVAVSGQLEYPAAEEIVRMPRYCPHNGEQADRGRGAGFPDDDAHSTNGCSCPKQGEGAVGRRDLDTPRVFSRTTSLALTHPVASLGRHGRRTRNQQRLSAARGRARISSHGTSVRASQREGCRRLSVDGSKPPPALGFPRAMRRRSWARGPTLGLARSSMRCRWPGRSRLAARQRMRPEPIRRPGSAA